MNAQGTATDAKARAPDALATLQRKGKKTSGKAVPAAALFPGKGSVSFAHIMSAKISAMPGEKAGGKSLSASLAEAVEGLKGAVHALKNPWGTAKQNPLGIALHALHGEKASKARLASGLVPTQGDSENLTLGKDEKSDGKKKIARLVGHPAGVTAEAGVDKPVTTDAVTAAPKHTEAPAAQVQNAARASAAPQVAVVHVVDLRKRTADKSSSDAVVQKTAQAPSAVKESGALFMPQQSALKDSEIPRKAASASNAAPQTGLERLREMAGSELIRATNLVLRDGGGEIRLVLKPESLGSVRIRMNLVDNKIEGRIIVDTSAVKQVMDQSIDALSRALTAGGFQTASLEVSVGGQNADNGRQMKEPPEEVRRAAAQGFSRNIPMEESLGMGDLLVNLFV